MVKFQYQDLRSQSIMLIISFAWTTPALIAGEKNVTRRDWNPKYAARFQEGQHVQAYDKSPRFGGKRVGIIRIKEKPYQEYTCHAPGKDYKGEGFEYMQKRGILLNGKYTPDQLWRVWMNHVNIEKWVVRFEIVRLVEGVCSDIMRDIEKKYGPIK